MINAMINIEWLTGYPIIGNCNYHRDRDYFEYYSKPSGIVRIGASWVSNPKKEIKLSGLCRYFYERKVMPEIIFNATADKIIEKNQGLIPQTFEEKKIKILEHLIQKGGKENKRIDINCETDFPLIYGNSDELDRIMESLESENFIRVGAPAKQYFGLVSISLPLLASSPTTSDGAKCQT